MVSVQEYTVVLRSRSGARVRRGFYLDLADFPDGQGGIAQVRLSTRWVDLGLDFPVPKELWMAVRVQAPDLDAALRSARGAASIASMIVSFCVNALVEPPALHLAFNSTQGLTRREFIEAFLPDESGLPRPGRWIDSEHLFAFGPTAFASPEGSRLNHALAQYQLALRHWNTGSRVLVLAHLYIACEALTTAVQRMHQARLGLTAEQHAVLLGVDITRRNWREMARNFARREYIFEGDREIYNAAQEARNEYEHGGGDVTSVRRAADEVARDLFDLVRSAILSLLPSIDRAICEAIMARRPVDVSPFHKEITGFIVSDEPSDPEALGADGELYPALGWRTDVRAIRMDGDNLVFEPFETLTVQFAAGLRFEGSGYAVYGGLNPLPGNVIVREAHPGQVAFTATELAAGNENIQIRGRDLLPDVMPLVIAAVASGTEIPQEFPRPFAFSLFGQGLAYFQSACTLIGSGQPVEALPSLRGLTAVAARFEQLAQDDTGGLGAAVRLALTGTLTGSDARAAQKTRDDLLQSAAQAGLSIPEDLPPIESTRIWRSLAVEMQLAQDPASNILAAAALHAASEDAPGRPSFSTTQGPGRLTDLIASACVIAQLETLVHAIAVFGWTTDIVKVNALLKEARQLNENAANPDPLGCT